MRRTLSMLFILIAALACRLDLSALSPTPTLPPTATATATATATEVPPSLTPTISPSPWPTSTPTLTLTPTATNPGFTVEFHPDGPLYTGDQVSITVNTPAGENWDGATLSVQIAQADGLVLGPVNFSDWGIARRSQATILWGWDTSGLAAGEYELSFTITPQEYTFSESVTLQPASAMPPVLAGAHWAESQTECCTIHYITGTAAERDLPALMALMDQQAEHAVQRMGIEFTEPITVTVMPRLLGHGGFASDEIYVTYLDRNYAANSWEMVVHHEMIHILDGRLGGDLRPSILVEGLAVYQTGGHFKAELLLPRAAALLEEHLGWYIPLAELADDFYASQHEIGYLEGGALVQYLVETYGWEAYSNFYRDIHPVEGAGQAAALDAGLQAHFGLTLEQTEQAFLAFLRGQPGVEDWVEDVRLTVDYFDTLRRYQELLDPSAYFRTAWLMDGPSMRARGIVGDYLRHPSQPNNLALEAMFISASDRWVNGDPQSASQLLDSLNRVLEAVEQGRADPLSLDPLAADYLAIATALQASGYELQSIELSGDTATVLVTAQDINLIELQMIQTDNVWQIN